MRQVVRADAGRRCPWGAGPRRETSTLSNKGRVNGDSMRRSGHRRPSARPRKGVPLAAGLRRRSCATAGASLRSQLSQPAARSPGPLWTAPVAPVVLVSAGRGTPKPSTRPGEARRSTSRRAARPSGNPQRRGRPRIAEPRGEPGGVRRTFARDPGERVVNTRTSRGGREAAGAPGAGWPRGADGPLPGAGRSAGGCVDASAGEGETWRERGGVVATCRPPRPLPVRPAPSAGPAPRTPVARSPRYRCP